MHVNEIRKRLKAEPFEPFVIHMVDGRVFRVKHPEFLHVFPGMERTAVLGLPEEQAHEIIDLLHVASLTIDESGDAGTSNGEQTGA
jgi:hypothetical protein